MQQQCFVIMPFGKKTDAKGREFDFKFIYDSLIKPAILKAGLLPIIAYEEQAGGIIHKPMYERIMFCEFSITDMTTFNANVFYELGMRHAIRPYTSIIICDEGMGPLPFDVALLRTVMYRYAFDKEKNEMSIDSLQDKIDALAALLTSNDVNDPTPDSPVKQTIDEFPFPDLETLKTRSEIFKKWAAESQGLIETVQDNVDEWLDNSRQEKYANYKNDTEKIKACQVAKQQCFNNIKAIETSLGSIQVEEFPVVSTLLFAYRAMSANKESISLISRTPPKQFELNMILHQQLAHAYNQEGEFDKAEKILLLAQNKFGKHPETNGLLGSVYKKKASQLQTYDESAAKGLLKKAIKAYQDGFDAGPSDYYPGINLLNLLFTTQSDIDLYNKYLPLVSYSIERRVQQQPNDYWAQASGMELEILRNNKDAAMNYLESAKASKHYPWEIASTLDSLKRIKKQKEEMKTDDIAWVDKMIEALGT